MGPMAQDRLVKLVAEVVLFLKMSYTKTSELSIFSSAECAQNQTAY